MCSSDLQGTNVQRQIVNTQQMSQDITSAYLASTVRLTSKLTVVGGVRAEETENYVRGALRQNSLGVGLPTNSKAYFQAVYSKTQRATSNYTDYFPNFQTTYRFTPDLLFRGAVTRSMSRPWMACEIIACRPVQNTAACTDTSTNCDSPV